MRFTIDEQIAKISRDYADNPMNYGNALLAAQEIGEEAHALVAISDASKSDSIEVRIQWSDVISWNDNPCYGVPK